MNKEKQCGISNLRLFKPFIFQNENLSLLLIREKHWNFVVSIFLLLTPPTYSTLSFHQKTNKQTKKSTKKNNQTKKKPGSPDWKSDNLGQKGASVLLCQKDLNLDEWTTGPYFLPASEEEHVESNSRFIIFPLIGL